MEDDRIRKARFDQERTPIAFLHSGMYVYANPAYLKLLGFQHFDEIEGIPLLDMVVERHHERLLGHLDQAASTPGSAPELPRAKLSFLRPDGTPVVAIASSHRTRLDGESCIQVKLRTREDITLKNTIMRLPWKLLLSVAFLVLFTLLPPTLLLKLNINNAPRVYFPEDEPAVVIDNKLREIFPNDEVFVLLFEGVALFSDGFLNAYHELAQRLNNHPFVDKVFSVTTQDHIAGSADGFLVEPLLDVKGIEDRDPKQRESHAVADRFAKGSLVAEDGSALSMVVVPTTLKNSIERLQLEQTILEAVEKSRLSGYLSALAGQIPLDVAELRSMLRDNTIFIPATVIIGLLLIWWLFRRWLPVLLGGISIGVVVSSTVAFYVVFGQPFTLISSIIPPLLSALTVATLVHLYNALHYAAQRGLIGRERVEHALREIRRPARFTSLTTAAGLASLGASPIPAIRSFGLISAAGVFLIYFVVIAVLPPIFARWDFGSWPQRGSGLHWMDGLVKRFFHLGIRYPVWVIVLTTIGLGAGLPALWQVKVETSLQEFFRPSHPIRQDTDRIEERMVGTGSLDVIFETTERDGLKSPEHLQVIRNFQTWVEQLPEVDKSISPADFIEEMNWGFNAEDPAFRRVPAEAKLVSQYLLVYDGNDLYDFVDREFRTAHVNLSLNVHAASEINAVMEKIRDFLRENTSVGLHWEIAGNSRLFADMEDLLVEGQVYSLWGALGLIFLLMLVLWRSFAGAILCMIPNLAPILLIFIVMGYFGLWLDLATAMIASVAVGIAVDDTIHVYHGYIHRVNAGTSPIWALARTFKQAGRAVMTTTVILSAQFMILVTSLFQPTAHFGLLTSIGLWAALVFDLVLLPAILIVLTRGRASVRRLQTTS